MALNANRVFRDSDTETIILTVFNLKYNLLPNLFNLLMNTSVIIHLSRTLI